MRSLFYLVLLGVVLASIAIVVRSGMLARKDPGKPINTAMRYAVESPKFTPEEIATYEQKYGHLQQTPSGLLFTVERPGQGDLPKTGALAVVHYVGRYADGTKFESSHDRGKPLEFRVGHNEVIKGWDEAVATMRKGERRTIIVPYWLGYGVNEHGKIPGRSTLIFTIEVVDFAP
jgi:FKBP-type peptidyl-prolyl cis-trans isomerase